MRVLASLSLLLAFCTAQALAGANPQVTLPLHAVVGGQASCSTPVNCLGIRPTVNVPPSSQITVYLLVFRKCEVMGVQTAFSWSPGWILTGSSWNCQGNQLSIVTPQGAGGPTDGSIVTAFDCVVGPALMVIGYMNFQTGASGCLDQVQSVYPHGIHVLDCTQGTDLIPDSQQARLGRICVLTGGNDGCNVGDPLPDCGVTPIERTTWGQIKRTYN